MSDDPFKGEGFSRDPFSAEELASHRELKYKASKRWRTIEGVDDLSKGGKRLAVIISVLLSIGAGIAYLVKMGAFQ